MSKLKKQLTTVVLSVIMLVALCGVAVVNSVGAKADGKTKNECIDDVVTAVEGAVYAEKDGELTDAEKVAYVDSLGFDAATIEAELYPDADGALNDDEKADYIAQANFDADEVEAVLYPDDENKDGNLTNDERIAYVDTLGLDDMYIEEQLYVDDQTNINYNGYLTDDEKVQYFNSLNVSDEEAEEVLYPSDEDKDGNLTDEEIDAFIATLDVAEVEAVLYPDADGDLTDEEKIDYFETLDVTAEAVELALYGDGDDGVLTEAELDAYDAMTAAVAGSILGVFNGDGEVDEAHSANRAVIDAYFSTATDFVLYVRNTIQKRAVGAEKVYYSIAEEVYDKYDLYYNSDEFNSVQKKYIFLVTDELYNLNKVVEQLEDIEDNIEAAKEAVAAIVGYKAGTDDDKYLSVDYTDKDGVLTDDEKAAYAETLDVAAVEEALYPDDENKDGNLTDDEKIAFVDTLGMDDMAIEAQLYVDDQTNLDYDGYLTDDEKAAYFDTLGMDAAEVEAELYPVDENKDGNLTDEEVDAFIATLEVEEIEAVLYPDGDDAEELAECKDSIEAAYAAIKAIYDEDVVDGKTTKGEDITAYFQGYVKDWGDEVDLWDYYKTAQDWLDEFLADFDAEIEYIKTIKALYEAEENPARMSLGYNDEETGNIQIAVDKYNALDAALKSLVQNEWYDEDNGITYFDLIDDTHEEEGEEPNKHPVLVDGAPVYTNANSMWKGIAEEYKKIYAVQNKITEAKNTIESAADPEKPAILRNYFHAESKAKIDAARNAFDTTLLKDSKGTFVENEETKYFVDNYEYLLEAEAKYAEAKAKYDATIEALLAVAAGEESEFKANYEVFKPLYAALVDDETEWNNYKAGLQTELVEEDWIEYKDSTYKKYFDFISTINAEATEYLAISKTLADTINNLGDVELSKTFKAALEKAENDYLTVVELAVTEVYDEDGNMKEGLNLPAVAYYVDGSALAAASRLFAAKVEEADAWVLTVEELSDEVNLNAETLEYFTDVYSAYAEDLEDYFAGDDTIEEYWTAYGTQTQYYNDVVLALIQVKNAMDDVIGDKDGDLTDDEKIAFVDTLNLDAATVEDALYDDPNDKDGDLTDDEKLAYFATLNVTVAAVEAELYPENETIAYKLALAGDIAQVRALIAQYDYSDDAVNDFLVAFDEEADTKTYAMYLECEAAYADAVNAVSELAAKAIALAAKANGDKTITKDMIQTYVAAWVVATYGEPEPDTDLGNDLTETEYNEKVAALTDAIWALVEGEEVGDVDYDDLYLSGLLYDVVDALLDEEDFAVVPDGAITDDTLYVIDVDAIVALEESEAYGSLPADVKDLIAAMHDRSNATVAYVGNKIADNSASENANVLKEVKALYDALERSQQKQIEDEPAYKYNDFSNNYNQLVVLGEKIGELEAAVADLQERVTKLEDDFADLDPENALGALGDRITALENAVADLDDTYATDDDITTLNEAIDAINETIEGLAALYATKAELNNVKTQLENALAALGNTYATDAELAAAKAELAGLINALDQAKASNEDLTDLNNALTAQLNALKAILGTEATDDAEATGLYAKLADAGVALEGEKLARQKDVDDLTAALAAAKAAYEKADKANEEKIEGLQGYCTGLLVALIVTFVVAACGVVLVFLFKKKA